MEQMEKSEDNKTPLPETDLEEVAGGTTPILGPTLGRCYFTPTGLSKRDASGNIWAKCSANCFMCCCHGNALFCVDKWHHMTDDGELYPQNIFNHIKKRRENNFVTQ